MTDSEFHQLKEKAKTLSFSPFANFMMSVIGYDFKTKKGAQLDKWEVYELGYIDTEKLLSNRYSIKATKKTY